MSMTPFYNQSSLQPFGRDPFFDTSFTPSSFSLMNRTPTDIAVQNPSMRPFAPLLSADLIESDTDYHVHCDLPGVERADLDITMNDGVLTIRAERKEVHEIDTDTVRIICTTNIKFLFTNDTNIYKL